MPKPAMPKPDARLDDEVELPPGPPDWQQDEADFLHRQAEDRAWRQAQAARAPKVLALLRRHIPAERWQEVETLLATRYGRGLLGEALRRDRERQALRRLLPAEHWPEIEDYFDTGIVVGAVAAALAELD
jgi:hypothetical protein